MPTGTLRNGAVCSRSACAKRGIRRPNGVTVAAELVTLCRSFRAGCRTSREASGTSACFGNARHEPRATDEKWPQPIGWGRSGGGVRGRRGAAAGACEQQRHDRVSTLPAHGSRVAPEALSRQALPLVAEAVRHLAACTTGVHHQVIGQPLDVQQVRRGAHRARSTRPRADRELE